MTRDTAPAAAPGTRIAVVGGGLAGLAAAVALRSADRSVTLFEARRYLGGRATSFRDADSGQWIDLCQHVSLGCCTNLTDFCRRTGIGHLFHRQPVLHFFAPDGRRFEFSASRWLPAPLHLAPAFWRLQSLSAGDRLRVGRALWALARMPAGELPDQTIATWLADQRQSSAAIEQFWSVVLVSALGESLDRASLAAARKVFVDGFMAAREAYVMQLPRVPLAEIYDVAVRAWCAGQGVELCTETPLRQVDLDAAGGFELTLPGGETRRWDAVVLAVPWRQVGALVGPSLRARLSWLEAAGRLGSSPISGVHLWFDRPITELAHAVLLGRLSQWVFQRGVDAACPTAEPAHYYQVVVSASRTLVELGPQATIDRVGQDLAEVFPQAGAARLLRARVVTDPHAVFSVQPGSQQGRPAQRTAVPGLAVAGDWTDTGWPATMEGAVRSGYLAAEALLADQGQPRSFVCPDLPRGWLARRLISY